ncbi:O-antigen ligase family protein [Eisenbergiella sp.]
MGKRKLGGKMAGFTEMKKNVGGTCEKAMQAVATVYLLVAACMVPLYMHDGYYGLGTAKFQLYRNVSFLALPVMVIFAAAKAAAGYKRERRLLCRDEGGNGTLPGGKGKIKAGAWLPELFLLAYGAAAELSFCLSFYKEEALFGAEGWYMGLFSQMSFLVLYFYYAYVWKAEKEAVGVILGVSGGICLLAVLNRFGIWPVDVRGRSETTLSTIGNVNWLCGYLSVLLPVGTAVFWGSCREGMTGGKYREGQNGGSCREEWTGGKYREGRNSGKYGEGQKGEKWLRAGAGAFTAAAFLCTAVQGSDSGFLIIGTALWVLFLISCRDGAGMSAFWDVFLTASGAVFAGLLGLRLFGETVGAGGGIPGSALFGVGAGGRIPGSVLCGAGAVTAAAFVGRIWWTKSGGTEKGRTGRGGIAGEGGQRRKLSSMRKMGVLLPAGAAVICTGLLAAGMLGGTGIKESLPSIFIFNEEWGNGRGGIWKECLEIWREQGIGRKLFGVGPDCLKAFLYAEQGSRPLLAQTYADAVLTNCHNEWMTLLMDTGLLGLVSYAGFLVSAAVRFLKKGGTAGAAGALAVITYTVHNMVSFQQITSTPLLFLAAALAWNSGCIKREDGVK